jgi:hypothetical protein
MYPILTILEAPEDDLSGGFLVFGDTTYRELHIQCYVPLSLPLHSRRSRLCCCSTRHTTVRMQTHPRIAVFGPK